METRYYFLLAIMVLLAGWLVWKRFFTKKNPYRLSDQFIKWAKKYTEKLKIGDSKTNNEGEYVDNNVLNNVFKIFLWILLAFVLLIVILIPFVYFIIKDAVSEIEFDVNWLRWLLIPLGLGLLLGLIFSKGFRDLLKDSWKWLAVGLGLLLFFSWYFSREEELRPGYFHFAKGSKYEILRRPCGWILPGYSEEEYCGKVMIVPVDDTSAPKIRIENKGNPASFLEGSLDISGNLIRGDDRDDRSRGTYFVIPYQDFDGTIKIE